MITIYRGATGPSGEPILEQTKWVLVDEDHPDAVELPASLTISGWWALTVGVNVLTQIPITPDVTDIFGNVTTPGGAVKPINPFAHDPHAGYTLLSQAEFLLAYADWQATDPLLPPLNLSGEEVLFVDPVIGG